MKTPKGHAMNEDVMKTKSNTPVISGGSQPAQPVEAVGVKGILHRLDQDIAEAASAIQRPLEISNAKDEYWRAGLHAGITRARAEIALAVHQLPALAHPRPTVKPELCDSELHASAPDQHHEIARAVWEHMNWRSAPGVIMTMAYTAVLRALASHTATVEQAGEVVGYFCNDTGDFLSVQGYAWHTEGVRPLPGYVPVGPIPRPVGVPDGEFNEGDRVVWTNMFGTEFTGTVTARDVSYSLDLDDGAQVKEATRVRAAALALAKAGEA